MNHSTFNQDIFNQNLNHFERLELERGFNLDQNLLLKNYLTLQKQFHPDKFAAKSQIEYRLSLEYITAINQAYEILKSPLKRAEYLLELENIEINSETEIFKPSQQILIEVLELKEQLLELSTKEELTILIKHLTTSKQNILENLGLYFDIGDYKTATEATIRLKYLSKLYEEAMRKQL